MKNGKSIVGAGFVLVDLRRRGHEVSDANSHLRGQMLTISCLSRSQGGTIRGSINLPAQSLYPTIPALYNIFKAGSLRKVIWYSCNPPLPVPFAAGPSHGGKSKPEL